MSEIIDVKIGQSFPPEEWILARMRLADVFALIDNMMETNSIAVGGKSTIRMFENDSAMAMAAMDYVARCASENIRYIAVPKRTEEGDRE